MIPMVDLSAQYHALQDEIDARLRAVLDTGRFVLGPEVEAFESEVAAYLGTRHAVGCASGTDAVQLALVAAGIGPGHDVITPAFTFAGTVEAICHTGARPVFADIDPLSFNIDAASVARALTPRTAAVVAVHLFGQPAELAALHALCDAHGLVLVEDCAQAFGATLNGAKVGSVGAFGCFSFYPSKNLGGFGDGGLVCTASDDLARRLRALRNHGGRVPYRHEVPGFNSRLDEIQAAVLRVKLRHVDRFNRARRRVAACYTEQLAALALRTPHEVEFGSHVFHQYTILCDNRDALMRGLAEAGVASAIHYREPLHLQPAFERFARKVELPVTDAVAKRCLSLPIYPEIPDEHVARVVAAIDRILA